MEDMGAVFEEHSRTVYKFLLALTHSPDMAEELTQQTFYQAVRCIGRFDGSCKLSVWLCQIAKHEWYKQLRRRERESPSDELPEKPGPSAEQEVCAAQGRMELLRQIHRLPEAMREVVCLRVFGGLSFREIGEVTGRPENWARVTFYRGKEKLKGAMHDES